MQHDNDHFRPRGRPAMHKSFPQRLSQLTDNDQLPKNRTCIRYVGPLSPDRVR